MLPVPVQVQLRQPNGQWKEVERTEVVNNNLNPKFQKKIEMDYTFERKQDLKFIVYDWLVRLARLRWTRDALPLRIHRLTEECRLQSDQGWEKPKP